MGESVIGIVFEKNRDKVLLVKRRDIPLWVLPGGGIELNEKPEEAVLREIQEETGFIAEIVRQTAEYTPINRLAKRTYVFECTVSSGSSAIGAESLSVDFFSVKDLPKAFFHIHKEWLDDCLLDHPQVWRKSISNVTYWKVFTYFLQHPLRVIRALLARAGFPINN